METDSVKPFNIWTVLFLGIFSKMSYTEIL